MRRLFLAVAITTSSLPPRRSGRRLRVRSKLEEAFAAAGAPWTPGRRVP